MSLVPLRPVVSRFVAAILFLSGGIPAWAADCVPAKAGEYSFKNSNFMRNIAMKGNIVYAATSGTVNPFNFRAIDVSNRSAPTLRGATVLLGELGSRPSIELAGNNVYVTSSTRLYVIDISNPPDPRIVIEFAMPNLTPTDVRVSGQRAFVISQPRSSNQSRLSILDVGAPAMPVELGFFQAQAGGDFDFNWNDVDVVGSTVWVAAPALSGPGGALRGFDVSNPAMPRDAGRFTDPDIRNALLATYGSHLLALGTRNLVVVDVSNPASPRLVAKTNTGGTQSEDLDVVGNRAFIADVVANKVFIYDLSALPQLAQIGNITLDAYRLAADAGTAAVVLFNDEILSVLDVTSCFPGPKRRRAVGH